MGGRRNKGLIDKQGDAGCDLDLVKIREPGIEVLQPFLWLIVAIEKEMYLPCFFR